MEELLKYLRAMVALQVEVLTKKDDTEPTKPELLMSRAGIPVKEIAELLGKNPAAVAKAIQRARQTGRTNGSESTAAAATAESVV